MIKLCNLCNDLAFLFSEPKVSHSVLWSCVCSMCLLILKILMIDLSPRLKPRRICWTLLLSILCLPCARLCKNLETKHHNLIWKSCGNWNFIYVFWRIDFIIVGRMYCINSLSMIGSEFDNLCFFITLLF